MDTKEWEILTYEISRGDKPVDEFITYCMPLENKSKRYRKKN